VNTDIAAIKEVLNQYAMGCTAGDLDLWMSLWANDGVQMPPDAPALVGKEEIRSAAKPEFDDLDMNLTILSIEDAKITGGLGLTRCVYKLEVRPKAGKSNRMVPGRLFTIASTPASRLPDKTVWASHQVAWLNLASPANVVDQSQSRSSESAVI
jgi:ketosteroid isomerase-like protein